MPSPGSGDRPLPYRVGRWAAEHRGEVFAFVWDPVNIVALAALLIAIALALGLILKLGLRALRAGWDFLHRPPGEVVIGNRREKLFHYVTDPPVGLRFEDARRGGGVLVGPTGQGKTTALLLMCVRALLWGHTIVLLEADGDLGPRLIRYARVMGLGKRCFLFDPEAPDSHKWNPLSGEMKRVVRQAASTVVSVSQTHDFYSQLNEVVMRQMTELTCAYAKHAGSKPTLELLLRLLSDFRALEEILDIAKDETGRLEVRAPFVEGDLKVWVEQEFLSWGPKVRDEYLIGLRNFLRRLLSEERVVEMLAPRKGERTIDLRRALDSGGLVVFRATSEAVGEVASQTILTWVLQRIQQETLSRERPMRPVWCILDEAHVILGDRNTATAQSYAKWFVQVRKKNVAPFLGYQSFFQLPDALRKVVAGSARTKLIFGGLHGDDARHAQELLGHTTRRKEEIREVPASGLFATRRRQKVTTEVEEPYYPLSMIEDLPVGRCFYKGVRGKHQPPPSVVRFDKLPSTRRLRGRAPGARRRRPDRKGDGR